MYFPEFYCSIYKRSACQNIFFPYSLIFYHKSKLSVLGKVSAISNQFHKWLCWLELIQLLVKVKRLCNSACGDNDFQTYAELYHWQKDRELGASLVELPPAVAASRAVVATLPPASLFFASLEPWDALLTRAAPSRWFQVGWFREQSLLPTRFTWISGHIPARNSQLQLVQVLPAALGWEQGGGVWRGRQGWKGTEVRYHLYRLQPLPPPTCPWSNSTCSPGGAEWAVGPL